MHAIMFRSGRLSRSWLVSGLLCWAGFVQGGPGAALTVSPVGVSNTYTGAITLSIAGLTNGETVRIDKYFDANTNGVIDAGDWLVQSFALTDGQAPMVIGGVTNSYVPCDLNPTNGILRMQMSFPTAGIEQQVVGKYYYRLSSPTGRFQPSISAFSVSNTLYTQCFTGKVQCGGTNVPYAGVLVFNGGGHGGPIAGTVADGAGSYSIQVASGTYQLWAFKSNYVCDMNAAATLTVSAGVTVTNNLSLIQATRCMSGRCVDAANAGLGLPGMLLCPQSQNGLIAIGFTDTNGVFSVPVTADNWNANMDNEEFVFSGYVGPNDGPSVDLTTGSVSGVTIALPKVTALIYGRVTDNLGSPIPGVFVNANDDDNHNVDAITDANGSYVIGALGGLDNDAWQIEIENSGSNYMFSMPAFNWNGGTNISAGVAAQVNFTALWTPNTVSGSLKDNSGNPIANIGINASANINGTNYQNYADTDATGHYSINVANGQWWLNIDNNSGDRDGLPSVYICPNGQAVTIQNVNATVNLVVAIAYACITNNRVIAITGCTGFMGAEMILPGVINGLPVTGIQQGAFSNYCNLTSITIPFGMTNIGGAAFCNCANLAAVYFAGNAPAGVGGNAFFNDSHVVLYYLPGTTGWGAPIGGLTPVLWNPQAHNLGIQANCFGFDVTGPANATVVVEACTNLLQPVWLSLASLTLTNGAADFRDSFWTNQSACFYRFRAP